MKEPGKTPGASQQLADELANSAIIEQRTERAQRVVVSSAMTRRRAVRVSLAIALPILIAVVLAEFAWQPLMRLFETAPPPDIARQQAQEMMDAVVFGVESFRKDYKTLPVTLVDIGVPPRGRWRYTAAGNGYTVEGSLYGQDLRFESSAGLATAPKTGQ